MQKISEEFNSVYFDQTVARILHFLNYKLEEFKATKPENYIVELQKWLVSSKKALELRVDEGSDSIEDRSIKVIVDTFDGVSEKTILSIELAISILKVNETLKLL